MTPELWLEAPAAGSGIYTGPIVDPHIHLFDPRRPQGIPWPPKGDAIHRPTLPADYFAVSKKHGVTGAIAVEASPWHDDNFWLLETLRDDARMLGFVGNLLPGAGDFLPTLERLAAEPLFLGIRCGNLWDRDLREDVRNPAFIDGLRALANSGRSLDSANPDARLIEALLEIAHQVPELRIVVDHLPGAVIPAHQEQTFLHNLRALAAHPGVFAKISQIPLNASDSAQARNRLDTLWELFGEDRCLFGSDWPNSLRAAPFRDILGSALWFMQHKTAAAKTKFFSTNSARAYRCNGIRD
jgi:L-fuconolactonase